MVYDNLKKSEIIALLEEKGVSDFNPAAKKEVLLQILVELDGEKPEADVEVDIQDSPETVEAEAEADVQDLPEENVELPHVVGEKPKRFEAKFRGKGGRVFPMGVFDSIEEVTKRYARLGASELILTEVD